MKNSVTSPSPHWDVAVIGAGLSGMSAAWHLALGGAKTILFEAGIAGGQGASAATGAIVRGFDPVPELQPLNMLGNQLLDQWETRGYPGPSPFVRRGFIWRMADAEAYGQALEKWQKLCDLNNHPMEIWTREITCKRYADLSIPANPHSLTLFEPAGGTVQARRLIQNLLGDFLKRGQTALEHTSIIALEADRKGWRLHLESDSFTANQVVLANGTASMKLWPALPLRAKSITAACFVSPDSQNTRPALIDDISGSYFCPLGRGHMLVGTKLAMEDYAEHPDRFPTDARQAAQSWLAQSFGNAHNWHITGLRTGWDAYTPDGLPLIGPACHGDGTLAEGVFTFTGCSGLGAKFTLGAGLKLAEWMLERSLFNPPETTSFLSLKPFFMKRFTDVKTTSQSSLSLLSSSLEEHEKR